MLNYWNRFTRILKLRLNSLSNKAEQLGSVKSLAMNYEPKKPAMNETPNITNIARSTTAPTNLALNFFDLIARVTCLIDHLVNQIQRAINAMTNTTTTISQTVMVLTYSIFRDVVSSLDQRLN